MEQTTLRTFTIMVYNSSGAQWFRSKDDLPVELRQKLEETMQSSNSATILLADRNGREELAKALRGTPSALSARYAPKSIAPSLVEQEVGLPEALLKPIANEGIGLVSMTKRIAISFTIVLLAIIAIFAAKIIAR